MTTRRLPAEWESQSGIMLTWPHTNTGWGKTLPRVEPAFAAIAAHASRYEKVLIVAKDESHQAHITECVAALNPSMSNISFAYADSNDSWARDHGPITVFEETGKPLLLDFQFNGWGQK
ncbi:agmatine deiminase family protein, partial [Kaarinaea lacus]